MLKEIPHVEVRFSARVTEVIQDNDGVTVKAETPNGAEVFEGAWVIGADGGGSIVRKCAGIEFDGFTYPEKKIRADQHAVQSRRTRIHRHGSYISALPV